MNVPVLVSQKAPRYIVTALRGANHSYFYVEDTQAPQAMKPHYLTKHRVESEAILACAFANDFNDGERILPSLEEEEAIRKEETHHA